MCTSIVSVTDQLQGMAEPVLVLAHHEQVRLGSGTVTLITVGTPMTVTYVTVVIQDGGG